MKFNQIILLGLLLSVITCKALSNMEKNELSSNRKRPDQTGKNIKNNNKKEQALTSEGNNNNNNQVSPNQPSQNQAVSNQAAPKNTSAPNSDQVNQGQDSNQNSKVSQTNQVPQTNQVSQTNQEPQSNNEPKTIKDEQIKNPNTPTDSGNTITPNNDKKPEENKSKPESAMAKKWNKLFSASRDVLNCKDRKSSSVSEEGVSEEIDNGEGGKMRMPFKARDIYTSMELGFGKSAYLFDFLDETLMAKATDSFSKILTEALKITPKNENYLDPYALATMLNGKPRKFSEINDAETEQLLAKIKRIAPKFNEAIWTKSVDAFRLDAIISEWKWDVPAGIADPARHVINQYDFNGDGRLNARELIIAAIMVNKNIVGTKQCINCLDDFVELIDPLFHYTDCNSNGKVSAEEIWNGLKNLKNSSKYNFFNCVIDNASYRTSAVNDFLLKSADPKVGEASLSEFRQSILLGYWNRHTKEEGVINDSSLSRRNDRWPDNRDAACEEMAKALTTTSKPKDNNDSQEVKNKLK